MKLRYLALILIVLLVSGCIPKAERVTMRHPSGKTVVCQGSADSIDYCIDRYRDEDYTVKSVIFKD